MAFHHFGGWNPKFGLDEGPPPQEVSQVQTVGYACWPYSINGGASAYVVPQPLYPGMAWTNGTNAPVMLANTGRYPQPAPAADPDMPSANFINETGGVGCEPGYNYFFQPRHTKVHVLNTGGTPPWRLPSGYKVTFRASMVPTNTTLETLLSGFGATNPNPKKNRIYEVIEGGNGRWYKGLCFSGDNEEDMKKSIGDIGWDESRDGKGKPVVLLWITKD